MRIAFVRARYTAHGGAERFAARAIDALVRSGEPLDVAVLARRWRADATGAWRVIRCDPFYVGSTWRDASFASAVRARLAVERFDLVQSHERIVGLPVYRAGDGVHASWLERRARTMSPMRRAGLALDPHHRYLVATERAMFEHPALRAVICNSTMVRDEIAARFAIDPAKLALIRNGVDVERFHPDAREAHRGPMRARLGLDASAPVFVLVGSGFERKGVAAAIAALKRRAGRAPRRRRRRPARGALSRGRRATSPSASASSAPVDDALPYLAMADAFVLPTLYDPFPNAALEAWAVGLPVITSDASGAAELVDERVNGWVVDAYDRGPLVDAMRDAVGRGPERTVAMADAARRTALPLSLDALADALTALYRTLLAPR